MAFTRPVNKVEGIIPQRNLLVPDNHLDGTRAQPARHFLHVGSALLPGAEEPLIVAARLHDHDVGSIRHIPFDAAEHHRRGLKRHSGIGDLSVDASGSKQALQLRGICSLVADVPAVGVAGADSYDSQRRGVGRDGCACKNEKAEQERAGKAARACCPDRAARLQFFALYLAWASACAGGCSTAMIARLTSA